MSGPTLPTATPTYDRDLIIGRLARSILGKAAQFSGLDYFSDWRQMKSDLRRLEKVASGEPLDDRELANLKVEKLTAHLKNMQKVSP